MFELYDESKKEELKKIYLERAQEKVRKLLGYFYLYNKKIKLNNYKLKKKRKD